MRRRHPPFALLLRACALVASLTMAGREAGAQGAGSPDPLLMRPVFDGDPKDPPRFRPPKRGGQQSDVSRFSQVPSYSYRPAAGAGTSGFDSTNAAKQGQGQGGPAGEAGDGSGCAAGRRRRTQE